MVLISSTLRSAAIPSRALNEKAAALDGPLCRTGDGGVVFANCWRTRYVDVPQSGSMGAPSLGCLARAGSIWVSRLNEADWVRLKAELTSRRIRVVALDLPTSWAMATKTVDEFTGRMFEAINGMLLDMLAAVARKDYDDRRRRQAQGQAKAKAEGRYKGRPEDAERNDGIARMLAARQSWGSIQSATGCSRATIAKIAKRLKAAA